MNFAFSEEDELLAQTLRDFARSRLLDESLKRKWLPAVASGDKLLSFGLTAPGVADAANLTTSAKRDGES